MEYILNTLTKKVEVDSIIKDTIDKVLVLRFGRSSDPLSLQLDDILCKSVREVSKFATVALVDIDSEDVQVYVKYFDITLAPSIVFFFNAHHMKMDSGSADHTKWVGAFQRKQDFIDVVEGEDAGYELKLKFEFIKLVTKSPRSFSGGLCLPA
ncbi:Thioredoxin-like protein 4B [Capsicum annuum]|nr:Thioredoxin-like protein 4B [Capsicum annuum]